MVVWGGRTLGLEDRDKPVCIRPLLAGPGEAGAESARPAPGKLPKEEAWSPNGVSWEKREHSPITEKATSWFCDFFVFQAQSPCGGPLVEARSSRMPLAVRDPAKHVNSSRWSPWTKAQVTGECLYRL